MQIERFKECNVTFAENQPEYLPLPAHKTKDGEVTSCWKLSFKERMRVLFGGRIFLTLLTFNHPLQPIMMSTKKPDFQR